MEGAHGLSEGVLGGSPRNVGVAYISKHPTGRYHTYFIILITRKGRSHSERPSIPDVLQSQTSYPEAISLDSYGKLKSDTEMFYSFK